MWVYTSFEPGLWTVGYYGPEGMWHPESDHDHKENAAERVHYLNGGISRALIETVEKLVYPEKVVQ